MKLPLVPAGQKGPGWASARETSPRTVQETEVLEEAAHLLVIGEQALEAGAETPP